MTERPDSVKRSPLEAKPLRNPGQSLDEEIERLTGDQLRKLLPGLSCVLVVRMP